MTNGDRKKAEQYLLEISKLIEESGGSQIWAGKLKNLAIRKTMHTDVFCLEAKALFEGMDSLSSLVLHDRNGNKDPELNDIFFDLRSRLYEVVC